MDRKRIITVKGRLVKANKNDENFLQEFEKFSKASNENNHDDSSIEPLDYDKDSSREGIYTGEGSDLYQDGSIIDDVKEISISKDKQLRETMFDIVVTKNVSKEVTESLLKMLSDYGINVPRTKSELISEFQYNDGNLAEQYAELKKQMTKMEATLEQIKSAIMNRKAPMRDILVTLPVVNVADLTLLDNQCADHDLINHFIKFRFLNDVIDDGLLLKFNWDGVQGKYKLSQFRNLHQTLFEAFKNEKIKDFTEYQLFVKSELRRIHNKHHQQLSRKRKSQVNYCKVEKREPDIILS